MVKGVFFKGENEHMTSEDLHRLLLIVKPDCPILVLYDDDRWVRATRFSIVEGTGEMEGRTAIALEAKLPKDEG